MLNCQLAVTFILLIGKEKLGPYTIIGTLLLVLIAAVFVLLQAAVIKRWFR